MFKKIIIPSLAFLGMAWMAFYTARVEDQNKEKPKTNVTPPSSSAVVLELFTSQGCSSCPPADALLEKAKKEFPHTVVALSYHVDYWNYIGWKDPFSKSIYTKKQSEYNRKFGYQGNYTPELVVNGREHFVGSNASKLYSKIRSYSSQTAENYITISEVEHVGKSISFHYSVDGDLKGKQLRAILVLDEKTTQVTTGENRNRTLRNSNIVVMENYIPLHGGQGQSSLSIPEIVMKDDTITLMVLVEADNLDITGAGKTTVR